jgi:DNA processing protein
MTVSEEEKAAFVAWHAIPGVGEGTIKKLVAMFGSALSAWEAPPTDLAALLSERSMHAYGDHKKRGREYWYESLRKAGVHIIIRGEAGFPTLLSEAALGYQFIYIRGAVTPADERAVSVVGTRKPTRYGQTVTRTMVAGLAGQGITIVSGLAYGIDGIAHTTALDADGRTIAILAGDVRVPTPVAHQQLSERVVESGALISTFSPFKAVTAGQFVSRDKVIAAMALGVLVTEGASDSGALHTASYAQTMNRPVMAVPGPITSSMNAAPTMLLKTGATLVTSAADVMERLGLVGGGLQREGRSDASILDTLTDPVQKKIVRRLLKLESEAIEALGRGVGETSGTVSVALTMLELEGIVEQVAGEYRLKR